jgi:hypothetical protein
VKLTCSGPLLEPQQGYFEGPEKFQQLMLRTQAYMDNSSNARNIVVKPDSRVGAVQRSSVGYRSGGVRAMRSRMC